MAYRNDITQWLHATLSFPPNVVCMSFFKLIIEKIGYTKSGSLKKETENNYYNVITKCDGSFFQSASAITKYVRYYKV